MLCNAFVIRLHRLLGLGAMSAMKEIHRTMLSNRWLRFLPVGYIAFPKFPMRQDNWELYLIRMLSISYSRQSVNSCELCSEIDAHTLTNLRRVQKKKVIEFTVAQLHWFEYDVPGAFSILLSVGSLNCLLTLWIISVARALLFKNLYLMATRSSRSWSSSISPNSSWFSHILSLNRLNGIERRLLTLLPGSYQVAIKNLLILSWIFPVSSVIVLSILLG